MCRRVGGVPADQGCRKRVHGDACAPFLGTGRDAWRASETEIRPVLKPLEKDSHVYVMDET